MKRLLMGITLSELGGSQKVVYDIISGLPDGEYETTLVTSQNGELVTWINELNKLRENKVNIIHLKYLKRNISIVNDIKAFIELLTIFFKGRYDIAHFHNSKIGFLGRIAAWITRVPRIYYTVHGWGINVYKSGIKRRLLEIMERFAAALSTKIICVSEHDLKQGIENGWIPEKKTCLIYNGISDPPKQKLDLKELFNIPAGIPVIASIARLSEPKDPLFTIRVAKMIKNAGYNFRLLIIGDGPLRKSCEKLVSELVMSDTVIMAGMCNEVRKLLPDTDIVVLFSRWEGFPISILEAMYAGKPVVASKVGGIPEQITDGVNGFLLDGFEVGQASNLIINILRDIDLSEKMGIESREIAIQNFTCERMVKDYIALYLM